MHVPLLCATFVNCTALPASPVINLEVCYNFTHDNQSSFLSVEAKWEAPMWPEGEVNEYDVFVNSSLGAELVPATVPVSISIVTH